MQVRRRPDGIYEIRTATHGLRLEPEGYEDIFFALPLETGSLFRLLNDTIFQTTEERTLLKDWIDSAGGVEGAMAGLAEAVQSHPPEGAKA